MIDPRHHSADELWLPGLANFQGPALLSWNNAQFSENDWESISKIHQSLKDTDPMKVGRFGLGFISIHHITGKYLLCGVVSCADCFHYSLMWNFYAFCS